MYLIVRRATSSKEGSSTAGSTALRGLAHGLHELIDLSVDSEELADAAVAIGDTRDMEVFVSQAGSVCHSGLWLRKRRRAYRSMQMLSPLLRSGSAYLVEMHLAWHDETRRLKTSVTISSSAVAASI